MDADAMSPRGDVYEAVMDLPGEPSSGIRHTAFAVSSDEYTARNGLLVLISSTRGGWDQVRWPFAFYLADAGVYQYERGRVFDASRPITATLARTFEAKAVGPRIARVSDGFFCGSACRKQYGADDSLRVQFQLPGRMASLARLYGANARDVSRDALLAWPGVERLSIWSAAGRPHPWLVVSNDTHNLRAGYVQALELLDGSDAYPLTHLEAGDTSCSRGSLFLGPRLETFCKPGAPVEREVLSVQLGRVQPHAEARVEAHLTAMFGLA